MKLLKCIINTDLEILPLLQSGQEIGLQILINKYRKSIYCIINKIVKSEMTSEEVLNDVFLKYFNKIELYDSRKGSLFNWMAKVARNASLDKIRTLEYRHSISTYSLEERMAINALSNSISMIVPEDLRDNIKRLNEKDQKTIEMVYFEGYTQSECAMSLSLPLGTVKSRLRRSIIQLRNNLESKKEALQ